MDVIIAAELHLSARVMLLRFALGDNDDVWVVTRVQVP